MKWSNKIGHLFLYVRHNPEAKYEARTTEFKANASSHKGPPWPKRVRIWGLENWRSGGEWRIRKERS
jgi:hypothetical protein